jgi:hypothetical protein
VDKPLRSSWGDHCFDRDPTLIRSPHSHTGKLVSNRDLSSHCEIMRFYSITAVWPWCGHTRIESHIACWNYRREKSPQCVSFHSDSDARAHASRALQADPTERARLLDRRGIEARPRGRPIRAKPRQETARGEPHTKIVFHASPTTLLHTLERKVAVRPGLSSSAGSPNLYHLRSLRATPQRGRSYEPTKQCHYNNTPCCIL